jgi:hypothetical protein
MTKKKILYCAFYVIVLLGCQAKGAKDDFFSPTLAPKYIHFTPSGLLDMNLEFEYPSSWIVKEITEYMNINIGIIVLFDSRSAILQTPIYDTNDGYSLQEIDINSVSIQVRPIEHGQTPETEAELFKQKNSTLNTVVILGEYETTINSYNARVVELQFGPVEGFSSRMFNQRIFFSVENNLYQIDLTIVDKDRGGEFEQGYEYLLSSIKITSGK